MKSFVVKNQTQRVFFMLITNILILGGSLIVKKVTDWGSNRRGSEATVWESRETDTDGEGENGETERQDGGDGRTQRVQGREQPGWWRQPTARTDEYHQGIHQRSQERNEVWRGKLILHFFIEMVKWPVLSHGSQRPGPPEIFEKQENAQ